MVTAAEVVLSILPNVVSLVLVRFAGTERRDACPPSPAQPPGYVFGVVWPALYLLIGLSAALLHRQGRRFELACIFGVVAGLNAWWLAFGNTCRPAAATTGVFALFLSAAVLTARVSCRSPLAAALLAPLVPWLAFATYLSSRARSEQAGAAGAHQHPEDAE